MNKVISLEYLGKGFNKDFEAEMFQASTDLQDYFVSYRIYNNGRDQLHVRKLPIPKRKDFNSEEDWKLADSIPANIYFAIGNMVEDIIRKNLNN